MRKIDVLMLIGVSMVVAGCQHNEWVKPGATQADMGRDRYECMQSALASAPPIMTQEAAWSGGQHQAQWNNKGGQEHGNNGGGRIESYDANASKREVLVESCLQSRGWQLITIKE